MLSINMPLQDEMCSRFSIRMLSINVALLDVSLVGLVMVGNSSQS